jgi:transcriptional regulator with XRE-family HTH domain
MKLDIAYSDISGNGKNRYKRLSGIYRPGYTRVMELRLKQIRKAQSKTQKQVADAAGLSLSYYTEIELGKKNPNIQRLEAIAKALNVQVSEIIGQEAADEKQKLVNLIAQLSETDQKLVLQMAETLARANGKS